MNAMEGINKLPLMWMIAFVPFLETNRAMRTAYIKLDLNA